MLIRIFAVLTLVIPVAISFYEKASIYTFPYVVAVRLGDDKIGHLLPPGQKLTPENEEESVRLRFISPTDIYCNGVLITLEWVVVNGDCPIIDNRLSQYRVYAGVEQISTPCPQQMKCVSRKIIKKVDNPDVKSTLMLLLMGSPFKETRKTRPAILPNVRGFSYFCNMVQVVGFVRRQLKVTHELWVLDGERCKNVGLVDRLEGEINSALFCTFNDKGTDYDVCLVDYSLIAICPDETINRVIGLMIKDSLDPLKATTDEFGLDQITTEHPPEPDTRPIHRVMNMTNKTQQHLEPSLKPKNNETEKKTNLTRRDLGTIYEHPISLQVAISNTTSETDGNLLNRDKREKKKFNMKQIKLECHNTRYGAFFRIEDFYSFISATTAETMPFNSNPLEPMVIPGQKWETIGPVKEPPPLKDTATKIAYHMMLYLSVIMIHLV